MVAQVSDLWVSYHNTEDGVSSVSLSLPHVVGIDARPWVLEEHSLVISAGSCSAHSLQILLSQSAVVYAFQPHGRSVSIVPFSARFCLGGYKPLTRQPDQQAESRTAGSGDKQQLAPSFATLHFKQQPGKAKLVVRLQQPNLVAEVGFILAVIKFAYPTLPVSGVSPIPFRSTDVLLQGEQSRHSLFCCIYTVKLCSSYIHQAEHRHRAEQWQLVPVALCLCCCSASDDCRGRPVPVASVPPAGRRTSL